jgi:hypothetical protein
MVRLAEEVVVPVAGAVVVGACPHAPKLSNKIAEIANPRLRIQPSPVMESLSDAAIDSMIQRLKSKPVF